MLYQQRRMHTRPHTCTTCITSAPPQSHNCLIDISSTLHVYVATGKGDSEMEVYPKGLSSLMDDSEDAVNDGTVHI